MGKHSLIQWTDHTFNPWLGCQTVSPGCDHGYAESWARRSGLVEWGPPAERRRTRAANWRQPLKWNTEAACAGRRDRVFCASLSDVFDNAVPAQWRADLLTLIKQTPNLDWLLLTKRIGNAHGMLQEAADLMDSGMGVFAPSVFPNVWIGTTVENQTEAERRIPRLLDVPARVKFLSCEPLLGPVDLSSFIQPHEKEDGKCKMGCTACAIEWRYGGWLDWVIVGGESGPKARPMYPEWARRLRDQCQAAGVPFFMKQMSGTRQPLPPIPDDLLIREMPVISERRP